MGKRATIYTITNSDDDKILRQKINSNFENLNHQTTIVEATGGGGGGSGISTHHELPDIDLPNCHPIDAITSLKSILDSKYNSNNLNSDLLTFIKKYMVVGAIYTTTASNVPAYLRSFGTWTNIGSQVIGTKTVNYFERTV